MASPAVAVSPVGAAAAAAFGVADTCVESGDSPPELTARTMKKYCVPLVRPELVNEAAGCLFVEICRGYAVHKTSRHDRQHLIEEAGSIVGGSILRDKAARDQRGSDNCEYQKLATVRHACLL